jgi:hypothetical protein
LWYAKHGWAVIPLHSVRAGGCTCGKVRCGSPGKHPRTPNGLKDGGTDAATIEAWWSRWPDANVGILLGAVAGMVAIDVDPRNGGDASLAELEAEYGALPATVEALTGGGGRHLFFAHAGGKLAGRLRAGIDVKADGGYVVAPPSLHASGERYRWRKGCGPHERSPASLPDWLQVQLCPNWRPTAAPTAAGNRPGDDFNRRGDVRELLAKHGWKPYRAGANEHWTRPGKLEGTSATLKNGVFYVFSTNAPPFETNRPYSRFAVFALLECGGDYEHAAAVLKRRGFGKARPTGARTANSGPRLRPIPPFAAFPVDALPAPAQSFVAKGAHAIGCDPSYIALPLLSALAAAIGNTRRIQLKRGWTEPAIIWTAIVGESGTLKTPAFKLVMEPVRRMQAVKLTEHQAAFEQHERDLLRYEADLTAWKREAAKGNKRAGDPPEKAQAPQPERYVVSDTTVEALVPILLANPRGLLLARDELAGWIGSFDRYVGGKGGADAAHWLSMHNGESIVVDRKTGQPRTIYVPSAAVSITGGVQPGILDRVLGVEHRESGLLARLLLAMPPRRRKCWTEATIPESVEVRVAAIFRRLYELEPDYDERGMVRPYILPLTIGGKAAWITFYNAHAEEHAELTGDLSAAWSKLEGYAARLALVVHLVRWAARDPTLQDPEAIDEVSIAAGVTLSRWLGHEARRIYAIWAESGENRDRWRLVELIQRKGGTVTARDLMRSSRMFATAAGAEAALHELAEAGIGRWEQVSAGPKRGKPTKRFVLVNPERADAAPFTDPVDVGDVDNTPIHGVASRGFVNVSAVNVPDNVSNAGCSDGERPPDDTRFADCPEAVGAADEWGEL